jgi:hypothetical protein
VLRFGGLAGQAGNKLGTPKVEGVFFTKRRLRLRMYQVYRPVIFGDPWISNSTNTKATEKLKKTKPPR